MMGDVRGYFIYSYIICTEFQLVKITRFNDKLIITLVLLPCKVLRYFLKVVFFRSNIYDFIHIQNSEK
jgi:hypothetical protein